jgi:flagellar protein FlaJ
VIRKKKEKKKSSQQFFPIFLEKYKILCYRLIGKHFGKDPAKYKYLEEKLRMANLKFTPDVYYATIIITAILVGVCSFFTFFFIFHVLINSSSWLFYVFLLTMIAVVASLVAFPFVMQSRISNRKVQLELDIPFILSELSILASTGLTPIKIVRHMGQREEKTVATSEFKKIVYKIDIEGKDLITALSETAKESPSPLFRETLWDLANMVHQGGDLDAYLRDKADTTMQIKRDIQKEFIDTLGTYAEIYITLVLVGVLFIGIAAFLMNAMGSTLAGFTSDSLLLLLSYGFIPLAIVVVNIIVSMAYAKSG